MTLLSTSILNGLASLIRIGTLIALNKLLAVSLGPASFALIGQFSNIVAVAGSLGGGAAAAGVTKYTAEHFDDEVQQRKVWRMATTYIFVASCAASLAILLMSDHFSRSLLGDASFRPAFLLLAAVLPMMAINSLLLAIMNGRKEIRRHVLQNIVASCVGAIVTASLAIYIGLLGALAALALNQSIVLLVTLWMCRNASWMRVKSFIGPLNAQALGPILKFVLMSLTASAIGPAAQLLVRNQLMGSFGPIAAGEWQAVFKISELYLMLFTATLSVYYLPRLAEMRARAEFWAEIRAVYSVVLPAAAVSAVAIYVLRDFITVAFFSVEFMGMTNLFGWQLVGDVLKIGSWILGFVMVGRAMVGWFIATEIIFGSSYVLLTLVFTSWFGLQGAPIAFAFNYALYWILMIWLVRRELREL